MSTKKKHGMTGKRNAVKEEKDKVAGVGRLVVDLGSVKARLVKAADGGKLKPLVVEILEEGLEKRGF